MKNIYIFSGPTLQIDCLIANKALFKEKKVSFLGDDRVALESVQLNFLPPVQQADVFRLVEKHNPYGIAIIDGYFEATASVWHKEILYALSEGVHVFGASSMGALRAAELSIFGMKGIGKIFEAYLSGFLEDDDEVTVAHGPAELGFMSCSDAMVNIRATMDKALSQGLICDDTHKSVIRLSKQTHYKQRDIKSTCAQVYKQQWNGNSDYKEFLVWLDNNIVDQKKIDALELISMLVSLDEMEPKPFKPEFNFEDTLIWRSFCKA